MKTMLKAALLTLALAVPAAADRTDDDLATVKKAVAAPSGTAVATAAQPPARAAAEREPEAAPRRASKGQPSWFRVRVVKKREKHGTVSINLPLGLVRAFGEDWPIHGCRHCDGGHGPTLGEVLRALDSGQSLVEIDDDEATVRVWVD